MNIPDLDENYWENRYLSQETGWDIGKISPPLKEYFDQLNDKTLKILIPGCGFGYEVEYLFKSGFQYVFASEISRTAKTEFFKRCPDFPEDNWISDDFFTISREFDLIIEQTFFCALHPSQRSAYVAQIARLLKPGGKLAGLLFNDFESQTEPPFGGNKEEYIRLFSPLFDLKILEIAYNSIPQRQGREFFILFIKK